MEPLLFFSIVIPTYNRPARLQQCLASIAQIDYSPDRFEVIVVDDGSEQSMESIVEPFRHPLQIALIRQPNAGPAKARNTGAASAKGRFLVFTDDDCTLPNNWLTALEARFLDSPNCLVGGHTVNALSGNPCSTASQMLIDYIYEYFNDRAGQPTFFASNNFAMPTHRFHEIGGFDTSFPLAAGEDREFCDRWLQRGYAMIYAPEVQIYHAHILTLQKFWRQHFNYGRGAFCFHQIRAERVREGIKIEPFSFYFNLITYPFKHPASQPAVLLSVLMLLSQVANVLGFFSERFSQSTREPIALRQQ